MNHARYTARILIVALIAPLILAGAALVWSFSLAARLPVRVVVHWDLAGHPNGYGSPFQFPIALASVCLPLIAIFGGAVVLISHRGPLTPLAKVLAVTSIWVTLIVSLTVLGSLLDKNAGTDIGAWLGLAFAAATVVAAAAWFVLPPGVRGVGGSVRPTVTPVALADGERASWIRTASVSTGMIWAVVAVCAVISAITIFSTIATGGRYWWFAFVPVFVLLVVLSNFAWTVRVDDRGLRIRSVLGIPVVHVPLDQVTSADVTDVQALSQYGGWGIRLALNGRIGVIVRSGEALEVHRRKGLDVVVTVDDASSAAALLNGLVKRSAS
ncbi:MAG TPA: DUF1648 domain-containing protein [Galbitalea sp.]|jgi:hypothetical protein|nr:DUF1648 domain-containing protein [Galbitalea sp.]